MIKTLIIFVLLFAGYQPLQAVEFEKNSKQILSQKTDAIESLRDQQYQFLLQKIFKVTSNNDFLKQLNNKSALEYLQNYQGQGRYESGDALLKVSPMLSARALNNEYQSVYQRIKRNLKTRGYIGLSKKPLSAKRLTDYKRTTNAFFETNLRDALNEVSEQVNIPFLMDDTVQGTITLKLENTPLDEALDMLLISGGFSYKEQNNYILIGFPQDNSPVFKHLSKTEVVHPVYSQPSAIVELLSVEYAKYIKTNNDSNSIVITAEPKVIKRIKKDIAIIDHRPAQIKLEVLIADISTSGKRKIGFDWWSDSAQGQFSNGLGWQSSTDSGFSFNVIDSLSSTEGNAIANNLALSNLIGETGVELADLGSSLGDLGVATASAATPVPVIRFFTAAFNAMSNSGEARVWATPSVVSSDGKKAIIDISTQQIIPIVSGPKSFLQVSTKEYTSGVNMEIVPRISSNGEISLDIQKVEVGTISFTGERQSTGDQLPVLTKRKISTTVALRNKETLIIGGLLDIQHDESGKSFPGLEDTGALGDTLLGTTKDVRETRDLVIFITPTLLEGHTKEKKMESFL